VAARQHPIELIQARTLISRIATAAFLVDPEGTLIFFNEAAADLLGVRFRDAGPMKPQEWGTRFEPTDLDGRTIPVEDLPLSVTLRDESPGHDILRIRTDQGDERTIEVSTMPLTSEGAMTGALAIFWPVEQG
jgi:PAS domain-containing protein